MRTLVLLIMCAACGGKRATDGVATGPPAASARDEAIAVRAGDRSTCALFGNGRVRCWGGWNKTEAVTRAQDLDLQGVVELTMGAAHGCARTSDGSMHCWGWNNQGQVGDGTDTDREAPVRVTALASAAAMFAGHRTTCTLDAQGQARCFGETVLPEATSVAPAVAMSAPSSRSTAALHRDGTITVWGEDVSRAFGAPAHRVMGIDTAVALGGGQCALLKEGKVACWGYTRNGARGDGVPAEPKSPTPELFTATRVLGLDDAIALSDRGTFACAVRRSGNVVCWGSNREGQLGIGERSLDPRARPVEVALVSDAIAITTGGEHACALRKNHQIVCWGANHYGELGDGSQASRARPVAVLALPGGPTVAPSHARETADHVRRLVPELLSVTPEFIRNRFSEECLANEACRDVCHDALTQMRAPERYGNAIASCLPPLIARVRGDMTPAEHDELQVAAREVIDRLQRKP